MKPSAYPHYHLYNGPAQWWRLRNGLRMASWHLVWVYRSYRGAAAEHAYMQIPGNTAPGFIRANLPLIGRVYEAWYWTVYWKNSCVHLCPCTACRKLHLVTFGEEQHLIEELHYDTKPGHDVEEHPEGPLMKEATH